MTFCNKILRLKAGFFLLCILAGILLMPLNVAAQKKTKIRLVQAETMKGDQSHGDEISIFTGNVIFEHDSAFLYCDSAVLNSSKNNLNAYDNVRIKMSDTLNLYGDYLNYEGNLRIATVIGNVRLEDNDATLTTDRLNYERNINFAYYSTGGQVVSDDNVLTSLLGMYFTSSRHLYFKKDVVLTNPEYVLNSDTLFYNVATEIAYILAPTTIRGEEEFLYAERGWYNTITDETKLRVNPFMTYKEQYMSGDSIYYEKASGAGEIFGNVFIRDSVKNVIVKGNYADYQRKSGFAYATDSAVAILVDQSDSLFMHADTLRLTFDSTDSPVNMLAYYKCKFFKRDLQGMADSLVYSFRDSTITMFQFPVLWTSGNQLTAELIKIYTSNQKVDSMNMVSSAFIVSIDKYNLEKYNQIKGRDMTGYFSDNELSKITVRGNSETIYIVREDDGGMIGINKTVSGNMEIQIKDRQVADIYYFDKPDANLFPENELPQDQLLLRDFRWWGNARPKSKRDIFRWSSESIPGLKK